ncbi:MAG: peptidylprolyl isomerase [Ignavibacterium sp.]|nr:peptidylprolyl isomerase [Ignavibacterium sp.]MDW8375816.1 peptidylprolyl isomerase [Ignavibacteriales bacterium]
MTIKLLNIFPIKIDLKNHINLQLVLTQLIIFSLFFNNTFSQDDSYPLAKIGSQIITVEEFRNRYEFMPHLNYSSDNQDTLRKQFLYSLIAEKLWALEGLEKRIDTLDFVKNSLKTLEKLFIKDELFKKEVESKIILTQEEISKGLLRISRILYVDFITTKDSNIIFLINSELFNGKSLDSLASLYSNDLIFKKNIQIKLATLNNELIEDLLFNLSISEITQPIKENDYWYIFKLVNEEIDSSFIKNTEETKNKVLYLLKERKRNKIANTYLDSLLSGKKFFADKDLFNILTDSLYRNLENRTSNNNKYNELELLATDVLLTLKKINSFELSKKFVDLDGYILTLEDFIYYLLYQKVKFPKCERNIIRQTLSNATKQFIEDNLIALEGYKLKLNELPSVKKDIEIWRDYYLSEIMLQSFNDSVFINEDEIESYLSKHNSNSLSTTQVNILEIFNTDLDVIANVLEELSKGTDFVDLAKKYNQRDYTKSSNGEWGYFVAEMGGEIGKIASKLNIGEIYGPIKVKDGYSIIKLLDKKEVKTLLFNSGTETKEYVKMKLSLTKINELINKNTVLLARKYGVEINNELLNKIQLNSLNMFTYKLIGFGGKIAAFPITIPIYEWYYQIVENNQNP